MKGNVLVLGNSGVGKSTLINAVLGTDVAAASFGTEGTTKELKIYGPNLKDAPFNLIDSVGFEPNWFKARQAVNAVKDWSKKSAKEGNEDNQVNIVNVENTIHHYCFYRHQNWCVWYWNRNRTYHNRRSY